MRLVLVLAGLQIAVAGALAEAVGPCAPAEILVRWSPARPKLTAAARRALEAVQARFQLVAETPLFAGAPPARAKPVAGPVSRWSRLRFATAEAPERICQAYASIEGVEAAQPNYLRRLQWTPNDSLYPQQWALASLGWPPNDAPDAGPVVVGVVDSGVDYHHPDLAGQVWRNRAEEEGQPGVDDDRNGYVDDVLGWDFADAPGLAGEGDYLVPDPYPLDESGHGTHVAGIIAAATGNRRGIAAVAPGARVMALRAGFNLGGAGYLEDDDAAAAMVYAADNGARVLNLSFGDPRFSPVLQDAALYASQAGCVLVAAAGNDGRSPVFYPAGFAPCLAVAASAPDGTVAAYSNWGAGLDLAAPGNGILGLAPGGGYVQRSGTSMAAAHVSGLAALLRAVRPGLDPEQVRAALALAAWDVGDPGWDARAGAGLARVVASDADPAPGLRVLLPRPQEVWSDSGTVQLEVAGPGAAPAEVWVGVGAAPAEWRLVARDRAAPDRPLRAVWHPDPEVEGDCVVRARLAWGKRWLERSVPVQVRHRGPVVSGWRVEAVLDGATWAYQAAWRTDVPAAGRLRVHDGGATPRVEIRAPPERLQQRILLPSDLPPGSYRVALEAEAGDRVTVAETLDVRVGSVATSTWSLRPLANLPDGYLLPAVSDFDGNGRPEIVAMPYGNDRYNPVGFYEYRSGSFERVYVTALMFLPWALCDLGQGHRSDLLAVDARRVRLLAPRVPGTFPDRVAWERQDAWGGACADLDRDGRPELVLRSGQGDVLRVFEADLTEDMVETAALANPTDGHNGFAERLVVGDLNGDGWGEVVAGDEDGDLVAFASVAQGAYRPQWREPGREGESVRVLGGGADLDGDGRPEFAVARLQEDRYDPRQNRWRLGVYQAAGDSGYAAEWETQAVGGTAAGNGCAVGDLDGDGRADLAVVLTPNLYVVRAAGPGRWDVVWHGSAAATPQPLVADLDSDQQAELVFSAGGRLQAWSRIPPPAGLEAPAGLAVEEGGVDGPRLRWEPVRGADRYRVYRGPDGVEPIALIGQPWYDDATAATCPGCWYAVAAVNASGDEGLRSRRVRPEPARRPRVTAVERASPAQIAVRFDVPMAVSYLEPFPYRVEPGIGPPASVVPDQGGRRVLLGFASDLPDTGGFALLLSGLSDTSGVALDPASRRVEFVLRPFRPPARLLDGLALGPTRVRLRFSAAVALAGPADQAVVETSAGVRVDSVRLEAGDRAAVVDLDPRTPLRPIGRTYLFTVRGLLDGNGRRVVGEVAVRLDAAVLERVDVFPNPFRPGRGRLTFGSLPRHTRVTIWELCGRRVSVLAEEDGDGGVAWDGTDEAGRPVGSGVLLYEARWGERSVRGRFALVRP